jgi:Cu+-exporting ATPase
MATATAVSAKCFHCGEDNNNSKISFDDKAFCCEGCKMVYQLLNKTGLCEYYDLNNNPGISQRITVRQDKFAFLDDKKIQQQLISFNDKDVTIVTLYLPQMHCSSCLYLLENLHKLNPAVISSRVDFPAREITIHFSAATSLRKVAELLTAIGYEPYISLNNLQNKKTSADKGLVYKLGIAGFCFGNIMLLSFPEYLGLNASEKGLQTVFRTISFILSLPVFFYSAQAFYQSAYKGLKHKFLNIDAPIVLAIWVTFGRSVYEVLSGTGSGYFDSMTGIVFFMLAGRVLQDKTYRQLSFARDYTSYFPIAVTVLKNNNEIPVALPDIKTGDTLLIHNEEIIPADGILTRGKAWIDYSFVTGESRPVLKETGEIVYAGGKQTGGNIEVLTLKDVSQSYLTGLWAKEEARNDTQKETSFVHLLSRWFTYIILAITLLTGLYWWQHDTTRLWNAVTSIMIIACPCALLLSNSFTNGKILGILSRNKFYLRNAQVIENIASADYVVFDKTGTLTSAYGEHIVYKGTALSAFEKGAISAVASQSFHPLSRALAKKLGTGAGLTVEDFTETAGKGITGVVNGIHFTIGSESFVTGHAYTNQEQETAVFIAEDGKLLGRFAFSNQYRKDINKPLAQLKQKYKLCVLTGDTDTEKANLRKLLGETATLRFYQKPEDKLAFIKNLQQNGHKVMMIGDGLNDAFALKQSNAGIAVADSSNNFTPSSDAIIEASKLPVLHKLIRLCKANKNIVMASFVLSILYNVIGLYFAVQGNLQPLIAAILMPSSSLSILLITFGSSTVMAKLLKL